MSKGPFFNNEVIRNKYVWFSIIASLAILIGVIQIPYARQALNVVSMGLPQWTIILFASISSVIIIQVATTLQFFKEKREKQ